MVTVGVSRKLMEVNVISSGVKHDSVCVCVCVPLYLNIVCHILLCDSVKNIPVRINLQTLGSAATFCHTLHCGFQGLYLQHQNGATVKVVRTTVIFLL